MPSRVTSWTLRFVMPLAAALLAGGVAYWTLRFPERRLDTIVPRPQHADWQRGEYILNANTAILAEGGADVQAVAEYLAERLRPATGFTLAVRDVRAPQVWNAILLTTRGGDTSLGSEGYTLRVTPRGAVLRAPAACGLSRGVQSLRQMLPPQIESSVRITEKFVWGLPCVALRDEPRFKWRGLLLDCSRHFMPKDFVKRYIDLLACHKLNVLHWHLTDDQGWRIEIKKRPRLTQLGAWRDEPSAPGGRHGGFYSQGDIREIVAYAASRYVTIIPEIEMPGHAMAALACYPEISCTGGPFKMGTSWPVYDAFCAGNEQTFAFLEDVLNEVVELFPAPFVHIGADEVSRQRWKACVKCQARIKAEGLRDEAALQNYFTRRVAAFLARKQRRIIGWDEMLEGCGGAAGENGLELPAGAVVQAWHGLEPAARAAKMGHDAIVSPTSHCYLDYDLGRIDLSHTYSFNPMPAGLPESERKLILGAECNLWTEYVPQERVDYQVFPRILGFAEALWTAPEIRDLRNFRRRLKRHYPRLEIMGVRRDSEFWPERD